MARALGERRLPRRPQVHHRLPEADQDQDRQHHPEHDEAHRHQHQQSDDAVFKVDDGNEAQQDCSRAAETESWCQEEGCPGGRRQGEDGQVDDQARPQG